MASVICKICYINDGQELLTCVICSRTFHGRCFIYISGGKQTGGGWICNGCFDRLSCWSCGTRDSRKTGLKCVICERAFHLECQKMFVCPFCGIYRAVIYPYIGWESSCYKCKSNDRKITLKCCACSIRVHLECYGFQHTCDRCKNTTERSSKKPTP